MLDFISSNHDTEKWDTLVPHSDPHFSSALYKAFGGGQLAVLKVNGSVIMQPFMHQEGNWIGNAYNFGGPIGDFSLAEQFAYEFDDWKACNNWNERCTLNPFVSQDVLAMGRTCTSKEAVYVDLTVPVKLRQTTRHCITKADRASAKVRQVARTVENATAFEDMYHNAMRAKGAASHWFYEPGFFHRILTFFGSQRSALFFTYIKGARESGCVVIHDGKTCYYHWAARYGTRCKLGVDHYQVMSIINWAYERGATKLCLGGGLYENDGLFTFKTGFSDLRAQCQRYETISGVGRG